MEYDNRTIALALCRGRVLIGLVLLLLPGVVLRAFLKRSSRETQAIARMLGAREIVLGLGTLTCVKERSLDAEWMSMCAVSDAVDAAVSLLHPGVSKFGRLTALVGGTSAVVGMRIAREFADERAEAEALAEQLNDTTSSAS